MSWYLLISPILFFVSFLAFMPFHLCFFLSAAFRFLSVCQASVFPLWFFPPANCFFNHPFLHVYPAVALFRLVLGSGTKPKQRQKQGRNSWQAAWHGLASLLPHPATAATATGGSNYAFAAGFYITNTMIVMTAGSATTTTAVASVTSTIADVSGCCRCCHCCYCCLPLLLPLLLLLLRIRVLILAYPGNQNIVFFYFCNCCCHSLQWWLRATTCMFANKGVLF